MLQNYKLTRRNFYLMTKSIVSERLTLHSVRESINLMEDTRACTCALVKFFSLLAFRIVTIAFFSAQQRESEREREFCSDEIPSVLNMISMLSAAKLADLQVLSFSNILLYKIMLSYQTKMKL